MTDKEYLTKARCLLAEAPLTRIRCQNRIAETVFSRPADDRYRIQITCADHKPEQKRKKRHSCQKKRRRRNKYCATVWSHQKDDDDDEIMSNDESLHIDEESLHIE